MPRVTLQSIADRVGVSRMTVSNAFSRPDQLSAELRQRILATADELGYHGPDPAARSLATGTSGAIGVLWTQPLRLALSDAVTARFLGAVADELSADALALTMLPPTVPAHDVAMDGAIAYSCDLDAPSVEWLRRRGVPVVGVDMAWEDGVRVTIDDRGGARAAAAHLAGLGHTRVAILAPQAEPDEHPRHLVGAERMAGWIEGLGGIKPVISFVQIFGDNRASITELLRRHRPTAVLCVSDLVAAQALAAAGDLGLRVPGDLSVVGFDDHPVAAGLGLTTVAQDADAKGRAAAQALRQVLANRADPAVPEPADVELPVRLVVRGSTGTVGAAG
ncbi:MAG: LacI family DNA-binding transcriptional regulator [Micropruina sp.]|uniref:LacI family DNA-binding transcriptional regulator n=1 Tax=Micropruina sp. TaxID=2737536 RepID=UPI0039E3F340